MKFSTARFAAGFAGVLLMTQLASAAEIKVYSTIGVKSVLEELIPAFEKVSGHKLNITWSTGALLAKRIHGGETADVLIAAPKDVEDLVKEGKIVAGSPTVLSRVSFAVGARKGAAKPDISTPEAFKKTLLAAKAITYTNPAAGGQSGVYFAKQLDRMGIAEQMKDKTKFPPAGGFAGALLVSGEADLAIQSKPELLSVSGVEVIGPLPGDMAFTSTHTAAIGSAAKDPAAAKALVDFLKGPEAQALFRAKGYDPA
jgi:molybdate transport system substrate-binding protein